MSSVDLRSDTVTRPTPAMREAMMNAAVGDDVYGEDPTVNALEERVAALCEKEAAIFVTSGSMGNQIAINLHTKRGDEVVIGEGAHCAWYEVGAAPVLSGVQFQIAGKGGLFSADELDAAIKPDAYYYPRTSLVCLENTHNRAGGRVFPLAEVGRISILARRRGLRIHIDGARIWNAEAATGVPINDLLAASDTASICFSKGLGAPVGSVLVGPRGLIGQARRVRKMLGGGMRQAGFLAAAALYALDHHRARLVEDHANAKMLARIVSSALGASVDLESVETNIVNIDVAATADSVVEAAAKLGVLVGASGQHRVRAVLHLEVSEAQAKSAAERLAEAITSVTRHT